jgi:biotin carboxyl carrier protein
VLCIIEAMKMMNQIEADRAGRIASVMARNGDPVEFGQPLFVVE